MVKLKLLFLFLLFQLSLKSQIDTTFLNVVSWNIQNFGKSKSDSEISYIANKLKIYDVVAIQEVSTSQSGIEAIIKLDSQLDKTGSNWNYAVSEPTSGLGSERYAYLYKTSRVNLVTKPYLESTLSDKIGREPFVAQFKFRNNTYFFFNLHLVPTDKKPELEVQQLMQLGKVYTGSKLVLMGDFNLSSSHPSFSEFKSIAIIATIIGKKTSLKMKPQNGEVLNSEYDNFFISNIISWKDSDVIPFYKDFPDLQSARSISDHCPIKICIN